MSAAPSGPAGSEGRPTTEETRIRTPELLAHVEQVEAALDSTTVVPQDVATSVRDALTSVRQRLALGVEHTVVALVGGTGSGKSSLFNALSGLEFADVGVRRPTTSQVTACVWAHDARALLDWLGVAPDRRIERESALDGESQADLRGLVLLDLPDHDSIEAEHRAVVDRVLPHADLIVWVVDPQKYADDALHSGYLEHLVGHEGAMLMVLNQIDTVPVDAQAALMRDVARLLTEDGLTDVGVHGVSARTGAGLPVLRGAIAAAVGRHGLAEIRAAAEIHDAARMLRTTVADTEPTREQLPVNAAVDGLAGAAGIDGLAEAVAQQHPPQEAGRRVVGPVHAERVAQTRREWLESVAGPLPEVWAEALETAVPPAEAIQGSLDERLATLTLPAGRAAGRTVLRVAAGIVGLLGLLAAGWCVGAVAGAGRWTDTATLLGAVGGSALLLTLALLLGARRAGLTAARRRGEEARSRARAVVAQVVEDSLVAPTARVLEEHRHVRSAASTAIPVTRVPTA